MTVNGNDKAVAETPLLFVGNNDYKLALPTDYRIRKRVLRVLAPSWNAATIAHSMTVSKRPPRLPSDCRKRATKRRIFHFRLTFSLASRAG